MPTSIWAIILIMAADLSNLIISLSVTYDRYSVSSTNKADRHDITEILSKEALNTKNPTLILLV